MRPPEFMLSRYFSFYEMTDTYVVGLYDMNKALSVPYVCDMTGFCREVLDEAREAVGGPLSVSSGFRCPLVNKGVGGSETSKHLRGIAADVLQYGWTWEDTLAAALKIYWRFREKGIKADVVAEKRGHSVWIHIERDEAGPRLWSSLERQMVQEHPEYGGAA